MFGKNKKLEKDIKKLEAKLALVEYENKMLKNELHEKDKKIDLMLRSMKAVNNAKKGEA